MANTDPAPVTPPTRFNPPPTELPAPPTVTPSTVVTEDDVTNVLKGYPDETGPLMGEAVAVAKQMATEGKVKIVLDGILFIAQLTPAS